MKKKSKANKTRTNQPSFHIEPNPHHYPPIHYAGIMPPPYQ